MTLHASDLHKLAKLLGMIGSAHDGEALAAARKVQQFVSAKGATWSEVLGVSETVAPPVAHRAIAVDLLKDKDTLTSFERGFLRGILSYQKLSPKQEKTLETIRIKVMQKQT